jgi:hypothetical protein
MKKYSLLILWTLGLVNTVVAGNDLVTDGCVNWADVAVLSEQWLFDNCSADDWCNGADLNHSGKVDFSDFALLAQHWFQQYIRRVAGFQDDETWTVSGTGVTASRDTTPENVKHGNCSLKVYVPSGTSGGSAYCTLPIPVTVRSGIGFWIKTDVASAITSLAIECWETSTGYQRLTALTTQTLPNTILKLQDNTWNFVWLPKAGYPKGGYPWLATGTPPPTDWGTAANPTYTITKIRFVFSAGGNVNIWFGDLVAQEAPKAAIILGFDGPYASVYTEAFPVMKARGWKGVLWVVAGSIGTSGFMTAAQIQELYDAGWDICSHGYSGAVFSASTATSVVRTDLENAIQTLHSNGWYRGDQFHSWMGNAGKSLPDADGKSAGDLAKDYFLGCRGFSEFTIPANMNGVHIYWYDQQWSLWIPPNWYNLAYHPNSWGSNTDFTFSMQGFVDLTIAMHGVLNTYTHRILISPGVNDISTGFFSDMIAYLDQRTASGEIEIITMSDWYNRIVRLSPYP